MGNSTKNTATSGKPAMNTASSTAKRRQWLWFIGLWCAGFLTISALGMVIKFFMNLI